jgi:hypothetical protein
MRAILKAQINKTDRNDARGMAPLGNAPDIAAGRSKWLHSDPAESRSDGRRRVQRQLRTPAPKQTATYSITSSARASSFAETFGVCVRPSRMKVFVANTWTAQSSGDE